MRHADTTILITGAAGSVGIFITPELLERGFDVRVLDRDVEPPKLISSVNPTRFHGSLVAGHLIL